MYLALVERQDQRIAPARVSPLELIHRWLPEFSRMSFPSTAPVHHEHWSRGPFHLFAWSNETENETKPILHRAGDVAVGKTGYFSGTTTLEDFARTTRQQRAADNAGGCFSIWRGSSSSILLTTDATRSGNIFYCETPGFRIAASRSLLAALVKFALEQGRPDSVLAWDPVGVRMMSSQGYFLNDRTAFHGVASVPPLTTVRLDPWRSVSESFMIESVEGGDLKLEWDRLVADSANSLVDALSPVGASTDLSLTGGRDSRLLAAALHAAGIDVQAATAGPPEHPDVAIATDIAHRLGWSHRREDPATDGDFVLAEEPVERIYQALDIHDGAASGWDSSPTYGPVSARPAMSGVGGEILRGGLVLLDQTAVEPTGVATRLRNTFCGAPANFQSDLESQLASEAAPWIDLATEEPHRALDDFYRIVRNGRWVSGRRSGTRVRTFAVDPLLDNLLIRRTLRVPPEVRWSERLVFDMIAEMAPQIRDLPIEGWRWRFEREAPDSRATPQEVETWGTRNALRVSAQSQRYHWHLLNDPGMRGIVKGILEDRSDGPAAEIIRFENVLPLFDQEKTYAPALWHLATAAVLVSDRWYDRERAPMRRELRVPVRR